MGAGIDAIIQTDEPKGYSKVQHKMIGVSTIFYAVLGLLFLFKSLPQQSRKTRYLTLFLVVFGSNLYFYITRDAGLSHGYSFFLFALLLYALNRFIAKPERYGFLVLRHLLHRLRIFSSSYKCFVFGSCFFNSGYPKLEGTHYKQNRGVKRYWSCHPVYVGFNHSSNALLQVCVWRLLGV